jgi:hypothetical protein
VVHLAGCGVPGNLKTDLQKLDLVFSGKQNNASLDIEFTVPPGPISGSTEMFVQGVFIKGGGGLDTTPLAYEMAETVFSKLFGKLEFTESSLKQRDGNYLLKLQAKPSTPRRGRYGHRPQRGDAGRRAAAGGGKQGAYSQHHSGRAQASF